MTFTVKALNEIVDDYIYGDDEIGIDVETPRANREGASN